VKSHLEERLAIDLRSLHVPPFVREHRFNPPRRHRFDFAWPEHMLAVEVDGGTHMRGRHNRPKGYEADCEKANLAALAGWRVLRFTGRMVRSGEAAKVIAEALVKIGLQA